MNMNTRITRFASTFGVLAAAVTLTAMTQPVQAQTVAGPDIHVQYRDLTLDDAAGATVLLHRIQSAAGRICQALDHGDLASRANSNACRAKLIASGVATVNKPMLTAVYDGSYKASQRVVAVAKASATPAAR